MEPEQVVEELLSALPGAYRGEGDGHVLLSLRHISGTSMVGIFVITSVTAVTIFRSLFTGNKRCV